MPEKTTMRDEVTTLIKNLNAAGIPMPAIAEELITGAVGILMMTIGNEATAAKLEQAAGRIRKPGDTQTAH